MIIAAMPFPTYIPRGKDRVRKCLLGKPLGHSATAKRLNSGVARIGQVELVAPYLEIEKIACKKPSIR
jgi:hypothetical protein